MALGYDVVVTTGWAVLDPDEHVIVLLFGADADQAAKDWNTDGYRILPVTL
jgi:hypothetical protein